MPELCCFFGGRTMNLQVEKNSKWFIGLYYPDTRIPITNQDSMAGNTFVLFIAPVSLRYVGMTSF